MTTARYIEDWDDTPHPCESFDTPWNGWATPVVTRDQLASLANRWAAVAVSDSQAMTIDMSGDVPIVHVDGDLDPDAPPYPLRPWADGLFHLSELGLTLWEITPEWPEDQITG
jgi:hypothetical protein